MRGDAGGVMQRAAGGFMLAIGKPHSKGAGHSEFTMMAAWGQPAPRALRSNGSAKPRIAAAASASSGGSDAPRAAVGTRMRTGPFSGPSAPFVNPFARAQGEAALLSIFESTFEGRDGRT
jgi:hypothetical protein